MKVLKNIAQEIFEEDGYCVYDIFARYDKNVPDSYKNGWKRGYLGTNIVPDDVVYNIEYRVKRREILIIFNRVYKFKFLFYRHPLHNNVFMVDGCIGQNTGIGIVAFFE